MVNVVAHSAQSGAHGGAALTDKTSEKKLSADAKESSCVFISARKPSFLKLPGFPIVPPPFNVKGRRPIPRLIGVSVCISELLLGVQAIRKFVKLYRSAPASRRQSERPKSISSDPPRFAGRGVMYT
jgi:hypothetical protein